jgi:hypothetical protein
MGDGADHPIPGLGIRVRDGRPGTKFLPEGASRDG